MSHVAQGARHTATASGSRSVRRGQRRRVARRRGLLRLVVLLAIIVLAVWLSVRVADASSDSAALADRHYIVKAGDTLWQIAGHFYGEQRDLRQVVFTLEQANALRGKVLQPGVDLRLPVMP